MRYINEDKFSFCSGNKSELGVSRRKLIDEPRHEKPTNVPDTHIQQGKEKGREREKERERKRKREREKGKERKRKREK